MSVYLITYHINGHHHYDADDNLSRKIKSLGSWAHFMPSSWVIHTELSSKEIVDSLKDLFDEKDLLFVSKVTEDNSGCLHPSALNWIMEKTKEQVLV